MLFNDSSNPTEARQAFGSRCINKYPFTLLVEKSISFFFKFSVTISFFKINYK